ncbi:MAG TPA: M1 family metallopeptidase [Flavisolibacter sp.]|nr:M1 family metallopeptidase [Flavisolibacter sp.]
MKKVIYSLLFLLLGAPAVNAQTVDVLHYSFILSLDDENDTIIGIANIRFLQKENTGKVSFDLAHVNKDGKGMRVSSVTDGTKDENPLHYTHQNGKLEIQLRQNNINDTASVTIVYTGVPQDGLIISKNKFGQRTFFADNWPNRAHHWIPCNDRPDDKASFSFMVSAPSHYSVVSNGIKIKEEKKDTRKITLWQEDIPQATKVMVIGVARFAVKTYDEKPGGVPISAWVYPKDSTKGFYDYAVTPGIVKFFSNYIAPYPYKKLANVQSTTIFGGMENASCIFYAENSVTGDRSEEDLMAHEIAHQWFGDAASEKSFAHLWLSEGFSSYMAHIYFENKYGKDALTKRLKSDRETVIAFALSSDKPVVDSSENLMTLLNANSYQKGAWVLHMLRNEVGDEMFQKIIQTYYQQYKGSNAETRDFEAVAEKVSGKELTPFFDQWLYQPGIPMVSVKPYYEKDVLRLTITQLQGASFQFPLEILVEGENGKQLLLKENIATGRQLSRHNVPFKIKKIIVDPSCKLLFHNVSK